MLFSLEEGGLVLVDQTDVAGVFLRHDDGPYQKAKDEIPFVEFVMYLMNFYVMRHPPL